MQPKTLLRIQLNFAISYDLLTFQIRAGNFHHSRVLSEIASRRNRNRPNLIMETMTEDSVIVQKTKELCKAILDEPKFSVIRKHIDTFLSDDDAQKQYQLLSERGEYLQHKQQQGATLSDEEIAEYETQREAFVGNPVAQGFLTAQEELNKVQQSVSQYVSKTFELGRVPTPEDMDSGSCGQGCGCHH